MDSVELFKYPPLIEARQIRLLQVSCDYDDRIRCKFVVTSLDDLLHPFIAMSYTWGEPSPTDKSWFDDNHYLPLASSASTMLRRVLAPRSDQYFWVDALCINQVNVAEKTIQVGMMYDIYSSAEKVFSWVGEHSNNSHLLRDFLTPIFEDITKLQVERKPINHASLRELPSFKHPGPAWQALAHFYLRPFFNRMWVLQELVAAKGAYFLCRDHCFGWGTATTVAALTVMNGFLEYLRLPGREGGDWSGITSLPLVLRQLIAMGTPPNLAWLLGSTTLFDVSDPRDKVFSLVNVSSDAGDPMLKPDYSLSTEEVYTKTTIALLKKDPSHLRLLTQAGIGVHREITSMPSWVPDWSIRVPGKSIHITTDSVNVPATSSFKSFAAAGQSKPEFAFKLPELSQQLPILLAAGHVFPGVESFAEPCPMGNSDEPSASCRTVHTNMARWLASLCTLLPSYPTGEPFVPDALALTLVANMTFGGEIGSDSFVSNFMDLYAISVTLGEMTDQVDQNHIPKQAIPAIGMINICLKALKEHIGSPLNELPYADMISRFEGEPRFTSPLLKVAEQTFLGAMHRQERYRRAMLNMVGFRRVFTTVDGYIGIGPPLMEEGDVICLLNGVNIPFVIRKYGDGGYRLVGECYVHGMMFGERMTGVKEDVVIY